MLESDQGRWLTYEETGKLLGITAQAARMLAKRRGWSRRTPNAYGDRALVQVPNDAVVQPRSASDADRMASAITSNHPNSNGHDHLNIRPLEQAIEALTAQLTIANERAADDGARAERERQRAEAAEQQVASLSADLVVAQVAEQGASERAKAATAEITELRRLLDVADRRIEGERTRAQQERERGAQVREQVDAERDRAHEAERQLAALVSAKDELRRQVDTLSELLTQRRREGRRSFWRRAFAR